MATIPGPLPGSNASNRRVWGGPDVEPKQQHRFSVNFPVYMPMGPGDDSSTQAAKYTGKRPGIGTPNATALKNKVVEKGGRIELEKLLAPGGDMATLKDTIMTALPGEDLTAKKKTADDILKSVFGKKINASNLRGFKVGPKGARAHGFGKFTSKSSGLYLRISEYIAYSFTPPPIQFTQGFDQSSDAGTARPNDALNKYNLGDATLTLVTTLRDDLHFSLNFLFGVASGAGVTGSAAQELKFPPSLYPDAVYAGDLSDKVLVIKEYSARQDTAGYGGDIVTPTATGPSSRPARNIVKGRKAGKTTAQIFGNAPARVVGIHKLNDPVIKSATFDEFTYGGTDLIKVTLVLGYGATTGMSGFYSYETTTSRYQRSYFTWQDDTSNHKDLVPSFNKRKLAAFREYPNWWSKDRVKATQKLNAIKPGHPTKSGQGSDRTGPSLPSPAVPIDIGTNKRRLDFIRATVEKGEPIPINELVTKGVAELLEAKEAAERHAANEAEEARQREHDNLIRNRAYAERQAESARYSEEVRKSNLYFEERERRKARSQSATDARIAEYQNVQRLEQRLGQGDDRRTGAAGRQLLSDSQSHGSRSEEARRERAREEAIFGPGGEVIEDSSGTSVISDE